MKKTESFRRSSRIRGETLLEVMLAVFLLTLIALGEIGLQWGLAREQHALHLYARAMRIADTVAETLRLEVLPAQALAQWQATVADALPDGKLAIRDIGAGVFVIEVKWHASGAAFSEAAKGESCEGTGGMPWRSQRCLSLAVAR